MTDLLDFPFLNHPLGFVAFWLAVLFACGPVARFCGRLVGRKKAQRKSDRSA